MLAIDGRSLPSGKTKPMLGFYATRSSDESGVQVYANGLDLTKDGKDEIVLKAFSVNTPSRTLVFDPSKPDLGTMPWEDVKV